ncbi:MAG: tRNA uridine-5-carboxymethylaminomethyl(34) synthesis GTPase MnmE [Firmicutes bacterium]|nr:tRNA uridine-5-carboxymethylaminomethyl(34) synthesis GTPase MnmE [Bacillota bacterium]
MREDTIAAIATATGEGGIGIVRISGEDSLNILNKIFCPVSGKINNRVLSYGHIIDPDNDKTVDEVMSVFMKGPHSYTAEDVVEIQCHGSVVSLRKILALTLKHGARLAERGEFTKRAFLNGRLDLSQAEAVIDLIKAKSDKTFDIALSQLEGAFSSKIKEIRADLVDILVNLTVNIDYPDEDIEEMTYEKLEEGLRLVNNKIEGLLSTADTGRIINEGLKVSIVGKPNVGKSSLMNALMGENRAIVTDIPGTTRDTIEESITIRDIPIILTDTAGIHETDDVIEQIGIEKSKESFNKADLVIFMLDASSQLTQEDYEILNHIGERKAIVLLNKTDIGKNIDETEIKNVLNDAFIIETAVREGIGISALADIIENMVYGGEVSQKSSLLVTNVRHKNILEESNQSIIDALDLIAAWQPLEFIEIDVNRCYELLGEIIGETAADDIIEKVFERFCLGK